MDYLALADEKFSLLEHGLEKLGEAVSELVDAEKGNGIATMKILHHVNYYWKDIEHDDYPSFDDWATGYTGFVRATVQRRICSWEFLEQYVPMVHKESLLKNWNVSMFSRGYRVAVKHKSNKRIGNYDYIPSGNSIEPGDWLVLSECIDMPMLIERLDKITEKEPNKNRISFSVDNGGSIWFYRGKKESASIGTLNFGSESELVQDGIAELMEKIGAK